MLVCLDSVDRQEIFTESRIHAREFQCQAGRFVFLLVLSVVIFGLFMEKILTTKICFRSSGKEKIFLTWCVELWD